MAVLEAEQPQFDTLELPQKLSFLPHDDDFITSDDFVDLQRSDEMFYGIVTITTLILVMLIFS